MFFKQPDLTSGSRPILQQDETLIFVQNGVGLYEGKFKIVDCQNGHAYLTSHRICYIDGQDPRKNSLAIDLRDVERHEYQAGFLRSSPKITFYPKPLKRGFGSQGGQSPRVSSSLQRVQVSSSSPGSRSASPFRSTPIPIASPSVSSGNWICPICSFTNPVPSNFDANTASETTPLPPCLTCGIKPQFSIVLKAAIAASVKRPAANAEANVTTLDTATHANRGATSAQGVLICPRCTFHNHPSLRTCEMCGAALPALEVPRPAIVNNDSRSASPAPEIAHLSMNDGEEISSVKFSFRSGGDKVFYDKLRSALVQRKWIATNAPPVPKPLDNIRTNFGEASSSDPQLPTSSNRPKPSGVGIAGLEQRGLQSRKNNEAVLGTAFEDLEALMASAKEIVALAEKFAQESREAGKDESMDPVLSESAAALGMVATKDMLGNTSDSLYVSELSRNLAEYVTDERRGILRKQGGTMSLVDLWATFNRTRDGVELISPSDFQKATEMWATLGLPVRLRRFKSGLLVVQQRDWSDEKTIHQLKQWLLGLQRSPPESQEWDWLAFGCGVTAQDAAQRFGWSLGVATEELEMAEERGVLCRDEGIEGLKFWLNYILDA